ncbi:MAG TPA: c-type cytochrome biogenesis protein CcmI [Phenylobacterium sp.]|jgi:cytochrome c-type biogenesis protein CcmH
MLWTILTLMAALAAVGLAIPLVRRYDARRARGDVVEVLKGQLGEIEAQAAVGSLSAEEAEALKGDVKRRVLAEGRAAPQPERPLNPRALVPLALGLAAIVVLGGAGLYLKLGHPAASAPHAASEAALPAGHPNGDVAAMVGSLEAKMKQAPNDPDGWRMLGWSYLQLGRNADAAGAYGRAAALDPHNAEYQSALGEATVLAASGQVTPPAEAAFRKAVSLDPQDPRARYYLAIARDQKGDQKGAMEDWIALLKSAPADAPWAPEVRTFVEKVAHERGVDLTGRLPSAPVASTAGPPAPAAPGPTSDQVAAAGQMSAGDRQAMITGMVARLADRLKQNPRDLNGWERLMRARMVLGQTDAAAQTYRDAQRAFTGSPADQASLRQSAAGLGIPGI